MRVERAYSSRGKQKLSRPVAYAQNFRGNISQSGGLRSRFHQTLCYMVVKLEIMSFVSLSIPISVQMLHPRGWNKYSTYLILAQPIARIGRWRADFFSFFLSRITSDSQDTIFISRLVSSLKNRPSKRETRNPRLSGFSIRSRMRFCDV